MKKTGRLFPAACVLCVTAIVSAAGWLLVKPVPLVIQGEVEAKRIDVASKIPGRVSDINVKRGDTIKKGQLLFTIDSPEIRAKLIQAEAAMKAASANREKAVNGARKEKITAALNLWKKAQAGVELAEKTYNRVKRLNRDGIIPAQKLDEAHAAYKAAERTAEAARASYKMAEQGARKEDKKAAAALVDKASGAVAEVNAFLDETRMKSPAGGEIADIIVDPGELAATGYPVVSIVDLSDVWVTFNMREDILSHIRMGKILTASFPALGGRAVDLKVNYIAALGSFATWHATKASGDFDLKTFEVRAVPKEPVEGLRPGMSAIVRWENI